VKCFHASGVAKWWVEQACQRQIFPVPQSVVAASFPMPFEELTLTNYESDQRLKRLIRRLGYYKIMSAGT
jgi:hypothetical protein